MKDLEPDGELLTNAANSHRNQVCTLQIAGMMCSACSGTIERGLAAIPGVHTAQVQLLLETAHVCFDPSVASAAGIADVVENLGFDASVTETMDETVSKEDLSVLNIYGKFMSAEEFGCGVRSSCQIGVRQYSLRYNAKLIGARKILAQARETDPLAEVETRAVFKSADSDGLLKDFYRALIPALLVFYITMCAPDSQQLSLAFEIFPGLHFSTFLLILLVTPVQFICGKRFHVGAWRAICNKNPNMEVLISVATNVAYFFSLSMALFAIGATFRGVILDQPPPHFFEAPTTLICFMLGGKVIEGRAKKRTARSIDRLMELTPDMATLKDSSTIPTALVELGDELLLFPGQRIPCDGTIVNGAIDVDESLLTGESYPIAKTVKDRVIGGSLCLNGNASFVVDIIGKNSTVNQILSLIETAQNTRAPVQLVADKVGRIFVPIVLVIATTTTMVWACLIHVGCVHNPGGQFQDHMFGSAENCLFALKFGLSVLLVACPCAIGLATPTAVMVASSVAADHGILIKSIIPLENTRRIKCVVMDKTGTLTKGYPTVAGCIILAGDIFNTISASQNQAKRVENVSVQSGFITRVLNKNDGNEVDIEKDFWAVVACAESGSEHPLARSILEACRWKGGVSCTDFSNGLRGIDARVDNLDVRIGSERFVREKTCGFESFGDWAGGMEESGCTVVYVCVNNVLCGALSIADNLAPGAVQTVQGLQARGTKVVMCTGDSLTTAQAVAHSLNIDEVYAEVLPQEKVRTVQTMQKKRGPTLMIGDGLNDAAALGQSDVGVAVGCGAQISVHAADVVLARSDITDLLSLFSLADATINTVYRNFAFSFIFNALLVPIAAGVLFPFGISLNPMIAGLCMAASSLCVLSSSLMLRNWVPVRCDRLSASSVGSSTLAVRKSAVSLIRSVNNEKGSDLEEERLFAV